MASTGAHSARRPAERRQRDRVAGRLRHRRLVDAQAPVGASRGRTARRRRSRAAPNTSGGCRARHSGAKRAMPSRASPIQVSVSTTGFSPKFVGGPVDARAVPIEIGRDAFESARAVEHDRAEPGRMRARPHDRRIALVPFTLEEGPGLRIADGFDDMGHVRDSCRGDRIFRVPDWHNRPNLLTISLKAGAIANSRLFAGHGRLTLTGNRHAARSARQTPARP